MRLLYHPDSKDISLAGVLYALGDPVRLEIVRLLATKGEQPCAGFDFAIVSGNTQKAIAKSTMSHHFRVLRESGVLYCRKEGTQHLNSLRREELDAMFPGLMAAVLEAAQKSPSLLPVVNKPQTLA
jgi:DNA-binding transcriptional ArsR family regulator